MNENYINYTTKPRNPLRAFLGFILTFFMLLFLIIDGYLISLKGSVLKGNDLNDILENCNFYDTIQEAILEKINDNASSLGLSQSAVNDIFSNSLITDTVENITKSITNDEKIDLSYLKDDCLDVAKTTSQTVVDEVFESIENSNKVLDASSLANNEIVKQFSKDFNLNVTDTIIDKIEENYGTTSINLNNVDTSAAKKQISSKITEKVFPAIDNAFDKYIENANDLANSSINKLDDEYNIKLILKNIEKYLRVLNTIIIVISILIIACLLIQLLLYKSVLYKSFKNFSIAALISGLLMIITGVLTGVFNNIILDKISNMEFSKETWLKNFISDNISSVNNIIIAVGVVYLVLSIIFFFIYLYRKKASLSDTLF